MTQAELFNQLDQSERYQAVRGKIEQLISKHPSRIIIAIAGLPGSGKSTLADYLADRINQQQQGLVASVSMDGFHYSKEQLNNFPDPKAALARRGAPWTFDSKEFCTRLAKFKQHPEQPLYWPSFDHAHGDPVENDIAIPASIKVLIVEGLYVLHQQHGFENAQIWLDESWFIDLNIQDALKQLAKRHQQAWGFSEKQAWQRIEQNDALNAQIADQSKTFANHIIKVR